MNNLIRDRVEEALNGLLGPDVVGAREVKDCLSGVVTSVSDRYANDIPKGFKVKKEVNQVGYAIVRSMYGRGTFGNWKLK